MEKIVFLGSGSMAEAIISGILKAGIVKSENIFVTNKHDTARLEFMEDKYHVRTSYNQKELLQDAEVVVLAMKPKDVQEALIDVRDYLTEKQLILSVIAGVMTEMIEEVIGKKSPVIRAMPNTSAKIGLSATALAMGRYVEASHEVVTQTLFQTIGTTKIIQEQDMHTVTAVAGSGPAFIYYFVEAMTDAAVNAGLDQKTADDLITQTIIGAGRMLKESGETPATLRKNITSQGGTTEAGLDSLAANNFEDIIAQCIESARKRSMELGEAYRI
ncbi:pyrroline-5-carboxylate reductase [Oceanobacillus sp. CAU 1775]